MKRRIHEEESKTYVCREIWLEFMRARSDERVLEMGSGTKLGLLPEVGRKRRDWRRTRVVPVGFIVVVIVEGTRWDWRSGHGC